MTDTSPDFVVKAWLEAELGDAATLDRVLHATGKSLVVSADYRGRPAVIKGCLTTEPFWQNKFDHELDVYLALTASPPPVRVPELIHTIPGRVLVIERIPGHPTDTERYPADPLDPETLTTILRTVTAFGHWNPPPNSFVPVWDYRDRVHRYHRGGYFSDADRAALEGLLDVVGQADVVAHGDPVPANLLLPDNGTGCVPIDFEYTGLFVAGFDLAMLHTILVHTPGAQARIEAIAAENGIWAPFLVNRAMVLSREIRIHTELTGADSDFAQHRLAMLRPQWNAFLTHLHDR